MSTNYYIIDKTEDDGPDGHIGLRSGAGLYCWDCHVSLCKAGENRLHNGSWQRHEQEWHKECPRCHKTTGIAPCYSFTWCMPPHKFVNIGLSYHPEARWIEDEYGNLFTTNEFSEILNKCVIAIFDSVGTKFS